MDDEKKKWEEENRRKEEKRKNGRANLLFIMLVSALVAAYMFGSKSEAVPIPCMIVVICLFMLEDYL